MKGFDMHFGIDGTDAKSIVIKDIIGILLWFVISGILRLIGFADTHIVFMACVWTVGVALFLVQICRQWDIERWMVIVVFTGYAGRCLLSAANIISRYAISRRSDSALFMHGARDLYQHIPTDCLNFSYLINVEFHIFGDNNYLVDLFNHLTIICTVFLMYYYAKWIKADKRLLIVAVVYVMFTPFQITYTMLPFREGWYVLCGAGCILMIEKWVKSRKLYYLVAAYGCCILPAWLHKGNISWIVSLSVVVIGYYICEMKKIYGWNRKHLMTFVLIASMAILLAVIGLQAQLSTEAQRLLSLLNGFQYGAYTYMPGNSDYLSLINYDNVWEAVMWTPIRMIYYFLSPMPWNWRGILDAFSFCADSLFHLSVFVILILFLRKKKWRFTQDEVVWFGLILLIITMFVYGWGTKKAGTAIRHRDNLLAIEWMLMMRCLKREDTDILWHDHDIAPSESAFPVGLHFKAVLQIDQKS